MDELEDLMDFTVEFAKKLDERAEVDGDPELYGRLRVMILTQALTTSVGGAHETPRPSEPAQQPSSRP